VAGVSRAIAVDSDALRQGLRRLVELGQDLAPVLDAIGAAMVQRTQLRFERGEGPDGVKWKPSERALKQGGQTLVDKELLKNSITHAVTGNAVEWGTNVVYAAIHQFGGVVERKARTQTLAFGEDNRFVSRKKAGRRKAGAIRIAIAELFAFSFKMPARPFVGVDAADLDVIQETIGEAIARAAGGDAPAPGGAT
jgi:phage virion morphogenesis protein